MEAKKDAFGQCLKAYLETGSAHEIIERDDGFITTSMGPAAYFSEFESWMPHVLEALESVRGRVLEVGVGAGRHALYLQSKGYDVTGIDNSPLALDVATQRGVKDVRLMSIQDVDELPGVFDTITMMGNNFGLLGGFEQGQSILKQFAKITSDDARIIADSMNPYNTDDPVHLEYHQKNRDKGRMGGQLRFRVRYRQYCGDWFDYLLASVPEVESIIEGTGWHIAQTFGDMKTMYTIILEK